MWNFCVQHAIHLINRLPTPLLKSKCPYELLYQQPPVFVHLKVFGCLSFASTLQAHRTKFEPRARKAVFLGFKEGTKGYILYDLLNHNIFVSRHVLFYETQFPLKSSLQSPKPQSTSTDKSNSSSPPLYDDPIGLGHSHNSTDFSYPMDNDSTQTNSPLQPNISTLSPSTSIPDPTSVHSPLSSHTSPIHTLDTSSLSDSDLNLMDTSSPEPDSTHPGTMPLSNGQPHVPIAEPAVILPSNNQSLRQSTRISHPPRYLDNYHCYNIAHNPSLSTPKNSYVSYPLSSVLSYDQCSPAYKNFCYSISLNIEPKTFNQAIKHDCWKKAMDAKLLALAENHTWELVDLPHGKTPIGCRWVYKVKHKADGSVERYKARLVAKGYTQMEGIDYFDTFSPVAKITTVRVLLSLAVIQGWYLEQLDVNNAFLHGDLHEEVYMIPPPGLTGISESKVCRLHKSLYGLKQASRQWYSKLSTFLISLGYNQSQADHSMYVKSNKHEFTALLVYVDDVVLAGNSLSEIHKVKNLLNQQFKIKDLGQLRFFLGFEIARSTDGIFLNQQKYTLELLEDAGLLSAKPSVVPFIPTTKLSIDEGSLLEDPSLYRRLIGRLINLTNSRPDISFSVLHLSQYVSKPRMPHYQAALHVLRYLKSAPAKGILFSSSSKLQLFGFTGSDWARCPDTRKSVTGYCVMLGSSLLCWKSKATHGIKVIH